MTAPTELSKPGWRSRAASSVLGSRDFRWLWTSQSISVIGDQVFPIAATVAVLRAGGDAAELGLVLGARFLAIVLFALVGGVWADRLPRRAVMMGANAFRAIVVGLLAAAPADVPVVLLAALVFAVGSGEAFFRPAETALLPSILPANRLPAANGLIAVSFRTAAVVGPGIGGVAVVGLGSVRLAFALNALAFVASLACLLPLREPPRTARGARSSFVVEMRDGLAEVRRHPWVLATLLGATFLLMLVIAPESVLLPIIGRREFGTDSVYAWGLGMFSVGGIAGALFAMRFRPRHPGQFGWLLGLLFITVPIALAFPVAPWPIYAAYLISGFSWEPFNVYWQSALQREIEPDKLARVSSVDWMASLALFPLGLALVGPVVGLIGEAALLWGSAVAMIVITLVVLRVPGVKDFHTLGNVRK